MIAKIDALFAVEGEINILPAHQRKALRNERSSSLVEELEAFLRERRTGPPGKSETAKAIDYSLKRWEVFTCFVDNRRRSMTTMLPNASCAPLPSATRTGPPPASTKAAAVPPRCTPRPRPPNSITLMPKLGWRTCLPNCLSIRPERSPTCIPGTGRPPKHRPPPDRTSQASNLSNRSAASHKSRIVQVNSDVLRRTYLG
ncbi:MULTISPECIES: transposase [unclassified Bradyrhizobium]|uniref:IS66 family transposase n=1 Tax=unclassified Bradyrhizobium TaxID=2631580 RepID=UPI0028E39876|nr:MULTISPECIES: transposase [unclassified Bradyrhizobium]